MKRYLYAIIALMSTFTMYSQDIDLDKAKDFSVKYMNKNKLKSIDEKAISKSFSNKKNDTICFHTIVFNGGGYINIAATEYSLPVLSVSTDGDFDENSDCPAYNMWMENYKTQILSLKRKSKQKDAKIEKSKKWKEIEEQPLISMASARIKVISATAVTLPVGPLIQTEWGQSDANDGNCDGYNFLVNSTNSSCNSCISQRCPAGCVAVAMAQVVRYWCYPFDAFPTNGYPYQSIIPENFDYDNMPMELFQTSPNFTDERGAIAELIALCGSLADMDYCDGGDCTSSTTPIKAKSAMNTLDYDVDLDWSVFNSDWVWKENLRDNLEAGKPLIYSGGHLEINDTYGHTFVCDGYGLGDDSDLFHFNWGWNGSHQNEWFNIGSLNPGNDEYNFLNSVLVVSPKVDIDCNSTFDAHYKMMEYIIDWFNDYGVMIAPPRYFVHTPPIAGEIITSDNEDALFNTIYSGESADYKVFNSVTLSPNFEVELGAELSISFVSCPNDLRY